LPDARKLSGTIADFGAARAQADPNQAYQMVCSTIDVVTIAWSHDVVAMARRANRVKRLQHQPRFASRPQSPLPGESALRLRERTQA
jgi:hypothetical protein